MPVVPFNIWAVLVAAAANYLIGAIWYAGLFSKPWMKLSGIDEMKVTPVSVILALIGALFTSFILAHAVIFANAFLHTSGFTSGIMVGALNWIGFIAPVTLASVMYEKKSWTLWLINNGYWLVSLVVMGIILAVWV